MKYIAYCRKSTDEKDRQILSIESQIQEIRDFSLRQHLEIIEFATEAKTAKIPGREVFKQVLKKIENGAAQGIISWHPDRKLRVKYKKGFRWLNLASYPQTLPAGGSATSLSERDRGIGPPSHPWEGRILPVY